MRGLYTRMQLWWRMRWFAMSCLCIAACAGEPDDDTFLVAVRGMDGDWVVTTPDCGTAVETPTDGPYEVVIVHQSTTFTIVRALRAAPEERPWRLPFANGTTLPCRQTPDDVTVPFNVSGAPLGTLAIGPHNLSGLEDTVSVPTGVHDVVAVSDETTPRFVIQRDVEIDRSGISIAFDSDGAAFEARDLTIAPQNTTYSAGYSLVTAGGTTYQTSAGTTGVIHAVPDGALIAGDQQQLSIRGAGALVNIDLRAVPSGPLSVSFPASIDAEVAVDGPRVTFTVTPPGAWNEHAAFLSEPEDGDTVTWRIEKRQGWPDPALQFPDVASIPGWQDAWNITPGWFIGTLYVCDRGPAETRCASARFP